MKQYFEEDIYSSVTTAITIAVKEEKYIFDMYFFLVDKNFKRNEVLKFLNSSLITSVAEEIYQLEKYLNENSSLGELYGWMGKYKALKFKNYLVKIIDDLKRYEREKRPGRKKGSTKRFKSANK